MRDFTLFIGEQSQKAAARQYLSQLQSSGRLGSHAPWVHDVIDDTVIILGPVEPSVIAHMRTLGFQCGRDDLAEGKADAFAGN